MNILALRTDKPEAEIYVLVDGIVKVEKKWLAHRQLAETLNATIRDACAESIGDQSKIDGIVFYNSGESFTGMRIGVSVANAFAASLSVPICASTGDNWVSAGAKAILDGNVPVGVFIDPHYVMPATITQPKK